MALQDMADIAAYIAHTLHNPDAALDLAVRMTDAVEGLKDFPYSNPLHRTTRPLKKEYRKLLVKSYVMFYWIDENTKHITIARVVYGRRDLEKGLIT